MSSRQKGRRTEKRAEEWLLEQGYIVDKIELGGRFRKYKDAMSGYCLNCWKRQEDCCNDYEPFGGFDLIALNLREVILLQIKTNQPVSQRPMKAFAGKFASKAVKIWCMTWYDRKGWRIQDYQSDGKTIIETDLRK